MIFIALVHDGPDQVPKIDKHTLPFTYLIIPAIVIIMSGIFPHVSNDMRIPVAVYTVVITAMVMLSVGTQGVKSNRFIVTGAVAFYFSDVAVARRQFMDTGFPDYLWGLPLYYAGQILLAISVLRYNDLQSPKAVQISDES